MRSRRADSVFWVCIKYVHLNPVEAKICERAIDYPWSSARLFEDCKWTEDEEVLPCLE